MLSSIFTSIAFLLSLSSLFCVTSAQNPPTPRWGQAYAIIEETLWVYGGKADPYNQFSYTSAPNTNDLFQLDLSQSFDLSNPPWHTLSSCGNSTGCQGPLVAFHSLSAYDPSHMLLFGGQPDPNSNTVLPDIPDSAWLLNVGNSASPSWVDEPQGWAGEPSRRMFHSASSSGGKVFIIGGQKADGSQTALSQHEVFDYNGPAFTALPTANGPPDLYGHTSLVLQNGSLLVFGGYCQSQNTLLSFSTIWILNTWADTFTWSLTRIDNTTGPSARRNFAAVVLSDGRILIHGGSDATLQTTYSDGWILDTTRDPMVWVQVDSLSALGPRRDHMVVAIGSVVIFGFGYGTSGPASTPITVYDPSTGTWPSTYTPPSPPYTPINTFVPTPTSQSSSTKTKPQSPNTKTPIPTATGTGSASTGSSHITAIVVGVVLGSLVLVIVSVVALIIVRRRRLNAGHFHMLYSSEDDGNSHAAAAIPVAQSTAGPRIPLLSFGIAGGRNSPRRRDMLADEDTRRFNDYSHTRDTTHTSSFLEKPASVMRGSWASLRSVGALFGVNTMGSRRAPSNTSSLQDSRNGSIREKDPFSDEAAFVPAREGMASRPKGGSIGSEWSLLASQTHYDSRDPFEDSEIGHYRDGDADAHSLRSAELDLDHTLNDNPPQSLLSQHYQERNVHTTPSNVAVGALPTVPEVLSYRGSGPSSDFDPYPRSPYSTVSRSQGELTPNLAGTTSLSLSDSSGHDHDYATPHGQPGPLTPTKSSLIDANPLPYHPVKRSDSWWSRFTKSAFVDRHASDASGHGAGGGLNHRTRSGSFSGKTSMGPLVADFRDPNPAPKLVAIEENSPESLRDPSRQASGDSKFPDNFGGEDSQGAKLQRSVTTPPERVFSNTAHGKSISSLQTTNTEALEKIERMDIVQREVTESSVNSWGAGEGHIRLVPTEFGTRDHENDGSPNVRPPMPTRPLLATTRTMSSGAGGIVASRVKAFENMEPKRDPVKYGLAPRQPLFVANPDSRKSGSSDTI